MASTERDRWEAQQLRNIFTVYRVSKLTGFSVTWVKRNTLGDTLDKYKHGKGGGDNAFHCKNPFPLPRCLLLIKCLD